MFEFKIPYKGWIYYGDCDCDSCKAFRAAFLPPILPPIKYLGDSDPVVTPPGLVNPVNTLKAKAGQIWDPAKEPRAAYPDDKGLRFNAGKVPLELIPPEWPWGLALVMRAGVNKGYPANNWLKGMEWSKCVGSMKRHTARLEAGEWIDAETGQPHVAMAAWNALALLSYSLRGLGTNDLFPPVNLDTIAK